jgi:hypothetical protein
MAQGGIDDLRVDATSVYLSDEGGQVFALPVAGGTPTVLATKVQSELGPVVDESAIYWVATGGEIMRMPKSPK